MPAYPNALMQATPRNALLGRLSDALAYTYSPERTQQAQMMAQFLGAPAISRTLDKLSYGEPLTTGAGGLGGTTRFNNDALEAAMTIAPMVGPAAKVAGKGAMATGRFVAPKAGQLAEQYMVKTGGILPLDVYHGTPHTLPPTARNPLGEFDASKIGTGEGAQVYGHGLYFAENPVVAKGYQEALSNPEVVLKDGTRISKPKTGSPEDVAKAWLEEAYLNGDKTPFDTAIQKVSRLRNSANSPKQFDGALNVLNEWKKSGASVDLGGNLYKIDLPDEKIAKMLDWDKPMSEQQMIDIYDKMQQSPLASFAKPFQDNFYERMNRGQSTTDGQDLFIELSKQLGGQKQVSDFLRSIDIPGIKYLDQGSRQPGVTSMTQAQLDTRINILKKDIDSGLGNQDRMKQILSALEAERASHSNLTRNFVTFPGEEKNMTILERNGQKFDNSALMAKKFDVVKRDASETFGAGAERFRYTDPASGGMIDVLKRPDNTASVLGLEVPEAFRGKGIGESLQSQVLQDFPAMMGQVSSKAAAKTAYRLGRRPPNQPNASLDDVFKLIDENSSVNLVSPKMQQTFNPTPTSTFDNSALMK